MEPIFKLGVTEHMDITLALPEEFTSTSVLGAIASLQQTIRRSQHKNMVEYHWLTGARDILRVIARKLYEATGFSDYQAAAEMRGLHILQPDRLDYSSSSIPEPYTVSKMYDAATNSARCYLVGRVPEWCLNLINPGDADYGTRREATLRECPVVAEFKDHIIASMVAQWLNSLMDKSAGRGER